MRWLPLILLLISSPAFADETRTLGNIEAEVSSIVSDDGYGNVCYSNGECVPMTVEADGSLRMDF